MSEWLRSKRQQITSAGKKGDQGNISILMVVKYIGIDSTENSIEISQKIKNRSIMLFNNSIPRYVGMEWKNKVKTLIVKIHAAQGL